MSTIIRFWSICFYLYSNWEYNKILYKFQNQLSFHTSCIRFVVPKHDEKNCNRNTMDIGEKCYGYLMTFGIYEYVSGKKQSKRHVDITYWPRKQKNNNTGCKKKQKPVKKPTLNKTANRGIAKTTPNNMAHTKTTKKPASPNGGLTSTISKRTQHSRKPNDK